MNSHPRRSAALRQWRKTPASLALAVVALLTVAAVVTAQSDLETPSPAQGRAQVVSQGMSARPALRATWRIVLRQIPLRADARPSDRLEGNTGFLLAADASIFVTDQDTKQRYRLAPGEAQFVPMGANQTWASLIDEETTAYTIELANRDTVDSAGGDEVVFSGNAFGMEEGDYDLDLVRDLLPKGEKTEITGTEFPIVIFATSGEIQVASDRDGEKTTRLKAGEALTFDGNMTITGRSSKDASFVAGIVTATIGGGRTSAKATPEPTPRPTEEPEETPEPTSEPKPTKKPSEEPETTPEPDDTKGEDDPTRAPRDGTSEVRLNIRLCPPGSTPYSFDLTACTRANGGYRIYLRNSDGVLIRLSEANRYDTSYVRWSDLRAGKYELLIRALPNGYVDHSLDGYICCAGGAGYQLRLQRGESVLGFLYFFPPAPASAPAAPVAQTAAPDIPTGTGDTDGDGIPDDVENDFYGTSPLLTDSDGDTIPDGVEAYGSNGFLTAPALPDTDGDGVDDNVEIASGTNPLNPESVPGAPADR